MDAAHEQVVSMDPGGDASEVSSGETEEAEHHD